MRGLRAGVSFMADILNTVGKLPLHAAKVSCFLGPIRVLGPARRILPSPSRKTAPPKGGSTGFDRKMQMGFSSASILVPKSMGTEAGLGWVGPGWAALGWAGLGWAGRGGAGGRQRGQGTHVRKYIRTKTRIRACMHAHRLGRGGTDVARGSVRNLGDRR